MNDVPMVTGEKIPRNILGLSMRSRTSVVATRSDLTRAIARSFSSCVSQRAVAGRSVSVMYEMRDKPQVMIPSMAKIILQVCKPPK